MMRAPAGLSMVRDPKGIDKMAITAFVIETHDRRYWIRQDQFESMYAMMDVTGIEGTRCSVVAICPRTQAVFCGGYYDDPVMHWSIVDVEGLEKLAVYTEPRVG